MAVDSHTDDKSVPDDAVLWRRINPEWRVHDEAQGRWRVSSQAFQDHPNGSAMSVYLASETPGGAQEILAGHEGYGLAEVTAQLVRDLDQAIVRDPLPEAPSHALVFGLKSDAVRRTLARAAVWVVEPTASPTA